MKVHVIRAGSYRTGENAYQNYPIILDVDEETTIGDLYRQVRKNMPHLPVKSVDLIFDDEPSVLPGYMDSIRRVPEVSER